MPSPLEPVPGAAQPNQMCEKLWTLPTLLLTRSGAIRQAGHSFTIGHPGAFRRREGLSLLPEPGAFGTEAAASALSKALKRLLRLKMYARRFNSFTPPGSSPRSQL